MQTTLVTATKFRSSDIKEIGVESLIGKNIVVYDLEIKKTIEQCSRGWNSLDEMGISVGCAFDYRDNRFKVFMDDNMQLLVDRLNEPNTLVVAFNHVHFDNKLLRASGYALKEDSELKNYDMLRVSREGAGLVANAIIPGFKLDDHLQAMGIEMKSANGAQAPIMWQQKRLGELVSYCLHDVRVERLLFEHMTKGGTAASAYKPKPYAVKSFIETFPELSN